MMDTLNSLANSQCSPRIGYKLGRTSKQVGSPKKSRKGTSQGREGSRSDRLSFWDNDADSSESEDETFLTRSPSRGARESVKSSTVPSSGKFSMTASPRRRSTVSKDSSTDSSQELVTREKEPVRRVPGRSDSGWHTSGSFSENDDDAQEKKPRNDLAKLSRAALRMSRSDNPSFSFTKTNATLDSFSSHQRQGQAAAVGEEEEGEENSNHSSASKNSSSYVSAGGWSTGKDTSSSEEEDRRRSRSSKKRASETTHKPRKHLTATKRETLEKDMDPFDEFERAQSAINKTSHTRDSKFSFLSGSSFSDGSAKKEKPSRRISTDSGFSLHSLDDEEEDNNGSFVFDLSAMDLDTEGIFEDEPISPVKRKEPATKRKEAKAPHSPKKEKKKSDKIHKKKASSAKLTASSEEEMKISKHRSKHKSKASKEESLPATKSKHKKKPDEAKTKTIQETKNTPSKEGKTGLTSTVAGNPLLEKRRQERAARLEKAKERIRNQEEEKKKEEEAIKKGIHKPKKIILSEQERLERAYQWYTRCGMLSKVKLKERIRTIEFCEISEEDVDRLPWMTGDRIVNVAKMTRILAGM